MEEKKIPFTWETMLSWKGQLPALLEKSGQAEDWRARIVQSALLMAFQSTIALAEAEREKANDLAERLESMELAHRIWSNKTEWVQQEGIGMWGEHRADIIKQEVDRLRTENAELKHRLAETRAALEQAEVDGIAAGMDLSRLPDSTAVSIGDWGEPVPGWPIPNFRAIVQETAGHFRVLSEALKKLKGGA